MIRASWHKILNRIDQMNLRERLLLLVTLAAVIYYLGQSFFLTPLNRTITRREAAIAASEGHVHALGLAARKLARASSVHPNRRMRQEIAAITRETHAVDRKLERKTTGLVNPGAMAALLEAVLNEQHGLTLVRAENLPPPTVAQESPGRPKRHRPVQPPPENRVHGEFYRDAGLPSCTQSPALAFLLGPI